MYYAPTTKLEKKFQYNINHERTFTVKYFEDIKNNKERQNETKYTYYQPN